MLLAKPPKAGRQPASLLAMFTVGTFAGIAFFSVPCARIGVRLAHHLSLQLLRRLFALLMLLVGLTLII